MIWHSCLQSDNHSFHPELGPSPVAGLIGAASTRLEASVTALLWAAWAAGCSARLGAVDRRPLPHTTTCSPHVFGPVTTSCLSLISSGPISRGPYRASSQRCVRPRTVARRQRWLRRPSAHHPLLLIAARSVETDSPGAKAPGFFVGLCDGTRARARPPLTLKLARARAATDDCVWPALMRESGSRRTQG
jgi:hypothetical protein